MELLSLLGKSCKVISIVICIINSNRVESAHAILKKYIQNSQGDLLTTWLAIELAITNQITTINESIAKDRIRTLLDIDHTIFQACFGIIITPILRKVRDHYNLLAKLLAPYIKAFTTT